MTKALADMFASAQTPVIEWEGEPVYAIYETKLARDIVVVEFLKTAASTVQGLTLKAKGGVLAVNGVEASQVLLWHDTAPAKVSLKVKRKSSQGVTLKLWNIWRGSVGGEGVTQAWLGNAGMRVNRSDDERQLLLRCSDGEGSIDFNDLVARVTID